MLLSYGIIGVLSGIAMGLIGLGGGAILMPLLLHAGMTLQQAIACVLFVQLVPQTLPGVWVHHNAGTLLLKECWIVAISSAIGVLVGAYVLSKKLVPTVWLYRVMSITLIVLGIYVAARYCHFV